MTTSFISPVPGDHNLQALRDFALEAPYEWRKTLEEVVELYEEQAEADDLAVRLDYVKDSARDLIKTLEQSLKDLLAAMDKKTDAESNALLDDYEKEVATTIADLVKALDEDDKLDGVEPPQKPTVLTLAPPSPA